MGVPPRRAFSRPAGQTSQRPVDPSYLPHAPNRNPQPPLAAWQHSLPSPATRGQNALFTKRRELHSSTAGDSRCHTAPRTCRPSRETRRSRPRRVGRAADEGGLALRSEPRRRAQDTSRPCALLALNMWRTLRHNETLNAQDKTTTCGTPSRTLSTWISTRRLKKDNRTKTK